MAEDLDVEAMLEAPFKKDTYEVYFGLTTPSRKQFRSIDLDQVFPPRSFVKSARRKKSMVKLGKMEIHENTEVQTKSVEAPVEAVEVEVDHVTNVVAAIGIVRRAKVATEDDHVIVTFLGRADLDLKIGDLVQKTKEADQEIVGTEEGEKVEAEIGNVRYHVNVHRHHQ